MKVQLQAKSIEGIKGGVVALIVFQEEKEVYNLPLVQVFLKETPKFGKLYETQLLFDNNQKILLIGAGKRDQFDFEKLQNCAGVATKYFLKKVPNLTILLPVDIALEKDLAVEAVVLGVEIAAFDLSIEYKSEKDPHKLYQIQILVEKNQAEYLQGLKKGLILAEAINISRRLSDMPSNEMTPNYFLKVAKKIAKENKLKLTVINEGKAAKMKMGAFTAVARGSDEPSYIIALEYKGDLKVKEKWGLIGKGVTFDSGGISIKPGAGMHEMKYDMSGAAAVLATIQVIAKLKLKANITAVMAVTENLPSGKAVKPGDIVKMYNGQTAEILNTDAEGRLVVFDALCFAQKDLKVTKIIDLATLTGAMIVALGDFYTGVFTNNDQFAGTLIEAGKKVGERYWQLPMDEIYDEMIKSDLADITNLGHGGSMPSAAGSITGAKFIEKAVIKNKPWIHLDIAGTAWDLKPRPYRNPGATGVGIKTLVKLIE